MTPIAWMWQAGFRWPAPAILPAASALSSPAASSPAHCLWSRLLQRPKITPSSSIYLKFILRVIFLKCKYHYDIYTTYFKKRFNSSHWSPNNTKILKLTHKAFCDLPSALLPCLNTLPLSCNLYINPGEILSNSQMLFIPCWSLPKLFFSLPRIPYNY